MKKNFSWLIALSTSLIFLFSCTAVRTTDPTRIGLLPLENYDYLQNTLTSDTIYRVIQSNEEFNRVFRPAVGSDVRQPDFNGQTVVAISVKDVDVPLRLERAEIVGSTIQVYTWTCPKPDCDNILTPLTCVATIPKVSSATSVRFFINNVFKKSVER